MYKLKIITLCINTILKSLFWYTNAERALLYKVMIDLDNQEYDYYNKKHHVFAIIRKK